ncbi:MAG: metal-dependent hydrolase [Halobacteriota archaeon]
MWPWEHVAVAYLAYSLAVRAVAGTPPGGRDTIALVLASQGPDLIDKPLSWGLGVFPTGYAVGHSVLVAGPIGAGVLALGYWKGRLRVASAVVLGYWSHLAADVLSPLRNGDALGFSRVLWPLVTFEGYGTDLGLARGLTYFLDLVASFGSMDATTIVVRYLGLPTAVLVLWIVDGTPGIRLLKRSSLAVLRR